MINKIRKASATKNSMKVEANRPIKEPKAAFEAFPEVLLLLISPRKAPKNAPNKIPKGMGINIPTINPMVAPIIPFLLPPKYFVPIAGMIYCMATMEILIKRVIPR